jgi:hypothetical protein
VEQPLAAIAGGLCLGLMFMQSTEALAAPDTVPKLNTRPSCESPARSVFAVTGSVAACLKHEHEAYHSLVKQWPHYTKADRTDCVSKVTRGGPPSYIELLSCFETMTHARAIREGLKR